MELLRDLMHRQHERGWIDDETARAVAREHRLPLHRIGELLGFYPVFRRMPPSKTRVDVCRDVVCCMADADRLRDRLAERLAEWADCEIHEVSCLGRCDAAPAVSVNDVSLAPITLADLDMLTGIAEATTPPPEPPRPRPRRWQCDPYEEESERYGIVRRLLAGSPDALGSTCIEALNTVGLRGMGGAGFPTGRKWQLVADEPATPKYVICNADESEPGTFKDRVILEELPHLVVEGMLLAGLTVGAERGILYLRHEYDRERRALEAELARAREAGLLGENVAGSGRTFDLEIFISPGGYILGEETALLEALEDRRGEPRTKPPYPGQHGLYGKPTLINNVETLALATCIVGRGVDWWRSHGVRGFDGLKFVCISGDVAEPGVHEIPVGTSVAELVDRAGGMKDGKKLLAFLPGGASSNFLTAYHADAPLEFGSMRAAGSMLGTGAVVVVSEGRDLFALATNLVRFFRNESCGKCVPCRVGSERAVELLEGVRDESIPIGELGILPELGDTLEQTSICGLGQVALNPALSMLKHFPHLVHEPASRGESGVKPDKRRSLG